MFVMGSGLMSVSDEVALQERFRCPGGDVDRKNKGGRGAVNIFLLKPTDC